MANIVIFGTGQAAELAHYYFTKDSESTVAAFTTEKSFRKSDAFFGLPWIDFEEIRQHYPPDKFQLFIALGYTEMNKLRERVYFAAKEMAYTLANYISSRCSFLTELPIGDNCFIMEDNTIQPFVKIGSNVTMWSGNHVGHHTVIGDHVFLTSHVVISGNCRVGNNCFFGVNATLRDGLTIAPETLIGAGAIVMGDTNEREVYVPQRTTVYKKTSDQVKL